MSARVLAVGVFAAAAVGMLAVAEPVIAQKEKGPVDLEFVFKSLDANGDKMLSQDEFAGVVSAVLPNRKKKAAPLDTKEMFKKLDTNTDGKLDLDEFKKLFTVLPMPKGKKN
ncbi:MAG: EF-hand domain pair [Gemmataceae bacterium]|nr:EF-hand domain pair [Gemmataceae bacterium]